MLPSSDLACIWVPLGVQQGGELTAREHSVSYLCSIFREKYLSLQASLWHPKEVVHPGLVNRNSERSDEAIETLRLNTLCLFVLRGNGKALGTGSVTRINN